MTKKWVLLRTTGLVACFLLMISCASRASHDEHDVNAVSQLAPALQDNPKPLTIIVIGGTSGIGLELVKLALERGHSVTAVSRRPARLSLIHPRLSKQQGDITDPSDMAKLLPNHDVIVSTVGLSAGSRNVSLFSEGITNIINQMANHVATRLIAVSAIGAGDSEGHGGMLFDSLLQPLILADDIADKSTMEQILVNSNSDFTVVRPAILTNAAGRGQYRVFSDLQGVETGSISRQDVAHFLLGLAEQNTYLRQIVTVSD